MEHVLTNALRRRRRAAFSWRDRVNLFKHAAHPDEVVIEDFFGRIKQLKYAVVAHGVIKTLADLVEGQLAVSQSIKDRYS